MGKKIVPFAIQLLTNWLKWHRLINATVPDEKKTLILKKSAECRDIQ